jgi:hypothetical protein
MKWCTVVLFCAGCGSAPMGVVVGDAGASGLAVGRDSSTPDLAVSTSGAGLGVNGDGGACTMLQLPGTCTELATGTIDWIGCHLDCSSDADCTLVNAYVDTFCFNACSVVTNKSADGAYLQSLTAAFSDMHCGSAGCACTSPPVPHCVAGKCSN